MLTFIQTIAFGVIPLMSDLWSLYLLGFVFYFGVAVIECGSYVWVISMWGSNSRAVLHLTKAMWCLGALMAPILDTPFVLGDVTNIDTQMAALNTTLRDQINFTIDRRPQLMIPFFIGSAICALSES